MPKPKVATPTFYKVLPNLDEIGFMLKGPFLRLVMSAVEQSLYSDVEYGSLTNEQAEALLKKMLDWSIETRLFGAALKEIAEERNPLGTTGFIPE